MKLDKKSWIIQEALTYISLYGRLIECVPFYKEHYHLECFELEKEKK